MSMKQKLLSLLLLVWLTGGLVTAGITAAPVRVPVASPETQVPEEYTLSQAYPNPFTTSTKFNLTVRHRQTVRVEVYNMLGQRVAQLFNDILDAGETRSFTIEAGNLPAGIYLYRVRGDRFTAARQVTLVR